MEDLDQARLKRILELGLPVPAPQVPRAPVLEDQPYIQAQMLEAQARPQPGPQNGKERLIEGIRAGLEGLAGGYTGGPGYFERQDRRDALERQRQQDLYARARELRQEGLEREKINISQQQEDRRREQADATLAIQREQLEQGKFQQGAMGVLNTKTGELMATAPRKEPNLTNLSKNTILWDGKPTDILEDLDPASANKGHRYIQGAKGLEDITGKGKQEHYEAPPKYGEPTAVIYDPAKGGNINVKRSESYGKPASQPAGVIEDDRDLENAARKIRELGTKYDDDFVGPAAGRYYKVKSYLPEAMGGSLPEGYPEFAALQADLKNYVIKLITGAQMGKDEAKRILDQVPTQEDRPEMWNAKYKTTLGNVEFLEKEIARQLGKAPGVPSGGGGGGGGISVEDFNQWKAKNKTKPK